MKKMEKLKNSGKVAKPAGQRKQAHIASTNSETDGLGGK
uniref:Uncharacterized protein n=1 Tax=Anguilla anguilla TaxID=7936 RepID=A0A0E9UJ91_ANGAN